MLLQWRSVASGATQLVRRVVCDSRANKTNSILKVQQLLGGCFIYTPGCYMAYVRSSQSSLSAMFFTHVLCLAWLKHRYLLEGLSLTTVMVQRGSCNILPSHGIIKEYLLMKLL